MTQTPFTVNEPNGNIYEKYKLRLANEPSRARTCDSQIKSLILYQLSYRFILALLSPLPSSENSCSDLGLLFNGIPGCIRTLLICELTSLTLYLRLQIPQQVVSALLLLRWFFYVTPQMTRLGVDMRKNVFCEVLSLRLFCLYPIP